MNEILIISVFLVVAGSIVAIIVLSGKKVLSIFPDISTVQVVFREKHASGYANDSFITKGGGASGVLDVVVTKDELWLKTGIFFALIAKMYRTIQKIKRSDIIKIQKNSKRMGTVYYENSDGKTKSFTLKLRDLDKFIEVMEQKI